MASQYYSTLTEQLYIAYLGRPADIRGLRPFSEKLAAAVHTTQAPDLGRIAQAYMGTPALVDLLSDMANSAESVALYGANTPLDTYVNSIFLELFNRPVKAAGLAYWTGQISEGKISRAAAPLEIMAGAYANTTDVAQAAIDRAVINNKTSVALHFTASIDTIDEFVGYSGTAAARTAHDMLHTVTATTDVAAFQAAIDAVIEKIEVAGYGSINNPRGNYMQQTDHLASADSEVAPTSFPLVDHSHVTLVGVPGFNPAALGA